MSNDKKYPLRILQIGMSTNYGGTEAFLMNLYRNIDRTRYQFDFLNVYDEPLACQDEIISLGGNIYSLHLRRRQDGLKKYKEGIKKFYREHHFDIVSQNVQDLINIDMLIYAKKYGIKKRIIYGHNSGFGMKPSRLSLLSHVYNKFRISKYVTSKVSLSDKVSNFLYYKKDRKNCVIIPAFINTSVYSFNASVREKMRTKYRLCDKRVYGSVLRLDPQKNPGFIIDVFNNLLKKDDNCQLIIVGTGPMEDYLKEKARKLGISNDVLFTGYVDNVSDYYSLFDFFLFPTNFEGFGIVMLEAQCSGIPIFCSYGVPLNAVATDLVTFLNIKDGPEEWAKLLSNTNVNSNRQKYSRLVANVFPTNDIVAKIVSLYE